MTWFDQTAAAVLLWCWANPGIAVASLYIGASLLVLLVIAGSPLMRF